MADDELHRELDGLRRRAYGRDADIQSDPGALARLNELEERLRPRTLPGSPVDRESSREPGTRDTVADPTPAERASTEREPEPEPEPAPTPRRRPSAPAIVLAAAVAVAVLIGGSIVIGSLLPDADTTPGAASGDLGATPSATPVIPQEIAAFTAAADTRLLIRIMLDGSFGPYIDLPAADSPSFPTDSPLEWAEPIGRYYGTHVWIARTESGRACLLVDAGARTHASCIDPQLFDASALLVTVPFFELERTERPSGMQRDESLGFWWVPEGHVDVMVGPTPGIGR